MKKVLLAAMLGFVIILNSCSQISNKSIMQKLSAEELAEASKINDHFGPFYQGLAADVDKLDDNEKAKFHELTYRRLFNFIKFVVDTSYWTPLNEKWEKEWSNKYSGDMARFDSAINLWRKYMDENSLDKQVKIECIDFKKENYEYIEGIRNIQLGFKLTALQGQVDEVDFTFSFRSKNKNEENSYPTSAVCFQSFSGSATEYWPVSTGDYSRFSGKDIQSFLRDYDVDVNINSITKNGTTLSLEAFPVPKSVQTYLRDEKTKTKDLEDSQAEVIKALFDSDFKSKKDYKWIKASEERARKDKLANDFLQYVS